MDLELSFRAQRGTCFFLFPRLANAAPVAASHHLTSSQLSGQSVRCTQTSAHVAPASNASAHQPSNPAGESSQHPFANRSTHSAAPNRDPCVHFDDNHRLLIDGKPF
jgi:hypothetical protein